MAHRFDKPSLQRDAKEKWPLTNYKGRFNGVVRTRPDRIDVPLRRKKPTVYQVWNDLFHEDVPDEFIRAAFMMMTHRDTQHHTFLLLTKRPERMSSTVNGLWGDTENKICFHMPRTWFGLTVCNQEEADAKIPVFLQVPGRLFLSIEPMLGPVDLDETCGPSWCWREAIQGVILGGETGPRARPMHPDWVRKVRDDCATAGVPFLFKQWGEWYPDSDLGQIKDTKRPGQCRKGQPSCYAHLLGEAGSSDRETDILMRRVGSKSAGRLLDGREHNDMPWRAS